MTAARVTAFDSLVALRPRRVVLLRALQLGDVLCAVPAFRALRAALPAAEITLVSLPWARALVTRLSCYLDRFLDFPGYPGMPEQPARLDAVPDFLRMMQAESFDLAIQLHGSGTVTNPLTALLGARRTAGCYVPGQYCPDPALFVPHDESLHEIRRPLRVLAELGVPPQGEGMEFPTTERDREALPALGDYVVVHPGARNVGRRWPAAEFAAVADVLARRGLQVVVTGSRDERTLADDLAARIQSPVVNLAGQTDLGGLAALLRGARLLVCNNTGVCHLGAAVRVPSVLLFHAPSEVDRWGPLDRPLHRIVCGYDGTTRDAVLAHARDLLDRSPARQEAVCAR